MVQTVKCLPTLRETQVRSLGGEDPLEKEIATHPSTLAWKIPWTEEPGRLHTVYGVTKSQTRLSDFTSLHTFKKFFSIMAYHKIINIVPCAIQEELVVHPVYI